MSAQVVAALKAAGAAIIKNKEYLTELDAAIGDADHGINMARGFEAVFGKLDAMEDGQDVGVIMKTVGMALISSVGGASGPLYGTAFLRAAGPSQGIKTVDLALAVRMLEAAIGGIKERGKAVQGEKTMLDSLEPALEAFRKVSEAGGDGVMAMEAACEAARKGVEYTKTIIATKGRASYLGERSIGHQDPGATSAYIMMEAVRENM